MLLLILAHSPEETWMTAPSVLSTPPAADVRGPTAGASAGAAEGGAPPCCLNCGTDRLGAYCHVCGQHYLDERLSVRQLRDEFVSRTFNLDQGLLRTFAELCRDPGGVVRRYVGGQRRRYISPFSYLFLGTALYLLTFGLIHDDFAAWMEAQEANTEAFMTPEQTDAYTALLLGSTRYSAALSLFMCVPFGLLLRLFFRKHGVNVVETTIFALFTLGHVSLLNGLATPILLLFGASVNTHLAVGIGLYPLVCGFAAAGFFGRRIGAVLKTEAAIAITFTFVSLGLSTAVVAYVLLFV